MHARRGQPPGENTRVARRRIERAGNCSAIADDEPRVTAEADLLKATAVFQAEREPEIVAEPVRTGLASQMAGSGGEREAVTNGQ